MVVSYLIQGENHFDGASILKQTSWNETLGPFRSPVTWQMKIVRNELTIKTEVSRRINFGDNSVYKQTDPETYTEKVTETLTA